MDHLENYFQLDENKSMVVYPYEYSLGAYPQPNEILSTFFKSQNLQPTWLDTKYDYGTFNKTSRMWTGAVAHVSGRQLSWYQDLHLRLGMIGVMLQLGPTVVILFDMN